MRAVRYIGYACFAVLMIACKKEIDKPEPEPEPEPPEITDQQVIREGIYDYYNKYSLWTTSIDDLEGDVLRTFTAQYTSYNGLLSALKEKTPAYSFAAYTYLDVNPGTHYDRYSYLVDDNTSSGQVSRADGLRMDTNEGYGMYTGWVIVDEANRKALPVLYFVEGGSPAAVAGITRGTKILALNGDSDMQVSYTCSGGSCSVSSADHLAFQTKWNNALAGSSMELTVQNVDGKQREHTLTSITYDIDPILADTVYADRKVGYFAFSSFEETDPNTVNRSNFEAIFDDFEQAGIQSLIVDMRYNTGGYVNTAEYLANKVIGPGGNGKVMFTYEVNDYLKPYTINAGDGLDFRPVKFARDNSLALEAVYFIVTEQTASAAELLINALKPHMKVVLVGETNRTYGKPVGFFEQEIRSNQLKVSLWATSFKTKNAAGETDYWNGLSVDVDKMAVDRIGRNFGDPTEDMIAKTLQLIAGTTANKATVVRVGAKSSTLSGKFDFVNKPTEKNMLKKRKQ